MPHEARWSEPRFETITRDAAAHRREPGVDVRVYSGTSGNARATTKNHVPVTLADMSFAARASVDQDLPSSYNGFVYVLDGAILVGDAHEVVAAGQVGWLDRGADASDSILHLAAGDSGARVMLYAGERTNVPIVMHGPFIGESRADLMRVSQDYLAGRFPRMSELVRPAS